MRSDGKQPTRIIKNSPLLLQGLKGVNEFFLKILLMPLMWKEKCKALMKERSCMFPSLTPFKSWKWGEILRNVRFSMWKKWLSNKSIFSRELFHYPYVTFHLFSVKIIFLCAEKNYYYSYNGYLVIYLLVTDYLLPISCLKLYT